MSKNNLLLIIPLALFLVLFSSVAVACNYDTFDDCLSSGDLNTLTFCSIYYQEHCLDAENFFADPIPSVGPVATDDPSRNEIELFTFYGDDGFTCDVRAVDCPPLSPTQFEREGVLAYDEDGKVFHYRDNHYIDSETGIKYDENGDTIEQTAEEREKQARRATNVLRINALNTMYKDKPLMDRAETFGTAARAILNFAKVDIPDWSGLRDGWIGLKVRLLGDSALGNFFFGGKEGISQACYAQQWGIAGNHQDAKPSLGNICGDACIRLTAERMDAGEDVPLGRGRYSYKLSYVVQPPSCGEGCRNCSQSWEYQISLYNPETDEEFFWVPWHEVGFDCSIDIMAGNSYTLFNRHSEFTHAKIEFRPGTNPRQYLQGFYGDTSGDEFVYEILDLDIPAPDVVPGTAEEEAEAESGSSEQTPPEPNTDMP